MIDDGTPTVHTAWLVSLAAWFIWLVLIVSVLISSNKKLFWIAVGYSFVLAVIYACFSRGRI